MRALSWPEARETTDPPTRRVIWLVVAFVVLHIVVAWLTRIPSIGWGEDDAGYIFLAKDLRHFGYRELQDIAAPIHARFPPGYPLLIAILGAPFGDALDVLLAINTLLTAATMILIFVTARRYVGDAIAVATIALLAINPTAIWDSGHVMAEALFKFLVMLGMYGVARDRESARYAVIAGAATIAAALTRSAGVVLLPALFLYWVYTRRYRWAATYFVAGTLTVGVWLAWTFLAPEPESRRLYVADLGLAGGDDGPAPRRFEFLRQMIARIPTRTQRLATVIFPTALALPVIAGTLADNIFWLAATVVFGGVGLLVLFRRWTFAALTIVLYTALLLIWRFAVERFANPLVPLLFVAFLVGADRVMRRVLPRGRSVVLTGFVALFAVGAAAVGIPRLSRAMQCSRVTPADSPYCWDRYYRAYLKGALWVRDSTPPDAVFFVNKERGFYYHTGRKTINQDRTLQEDSLSLAPYLRARGVTHAVAAPVGILSDRHNHLLALACRDFAVERTFPDVTVVLRLRAVGEPPGDDACVALEPWRRRVPRRGTG